MSVSGEIVNILAARNSWLLEELLEESIFSREATLTALLELIVSGEIELEFEDHDDGSESTLIIRTVQ